MTQGKRSTWWKRFFGSVVLGTWVAACGGPAPESEAPMDEVEVEQPGVDSEEPDQGLTEAQSLERNWHRPLPPPRSLALSGPAVAYGSGKFLVVWEDVREGGVYGARVKSDGTLLDPEGIRLNTSERSGGEVAVAYDGRNFLVIWHESDGIFGIRVRPDGTLLGSVFTVILADEIDEPAIACAPKKVCLVTYTSEGDFDSNIGFRLVRPDNTVIRPPPGTVLGSAGDTFATESSVAWDGKQFMVVWSDTIGGVDSPDIYGGRVSPAGSIIGSPEGFAISDAPGAQTSPDVTWTGRRFLTVWEDTRDDPRGDIFGARVRKDTTVDDPDGIPISDDDESFPDVDPAVAHHNSKSLVVWRSGDSIVGARVHEDGDVMDPGGFLIARESDEQFLPDVAYGDNRFLTVYGHAGSFEPPFPIRGKLVKHDTRVGPLIDITRTFEDLPAPIGAPVPGSQP